MKIAVVYNWVERATDDIPLPENWIDILKRFVGSYRAFDAGYAHDLYICASGAPLTRDSTEILSGTRFGVLRYNGGGWDIGAFQHAAKHLSHYDFVVCLNSQAHIRHAGWLRHFAEAFERFGVGVYGASSSFQVSPHIRTCCIAFTPRLILEYPLEIRCRYDACVFEHSPKGFSLWALEQGLPVCVVTRSGVDPLAESRKRPDIFRRGSQGDLLIHDRHTILYDSASPAARERLEEQADGKLDEPFLFLGPIHHMLVRNPLLKKTHSLAVAVRDRARDGLKRLRS
jgi:hypothetical protein